MTGSQTQNGGGGYAESDFYSLAAAAKRNRFVAGGDGGSDGVFPAVGSDGVFSAGSEAGSDGVPAGNVAGTTTGGYSSKLYRDSSAIRGAGEQGERFVPMKFPAPLRNAIEKIRM